MIYPILNGGFVEMDRALLELMHNPYWFEGHGVILESRARSLFHGPHENKTLFMISWFKTRRNVCED